MLRLHQGRSPVQNVLRFRRERLPFHHNNNEIPSPPSQRQEAVSSLTRSRFRFQNWCFVFTTDLPFLHHAAKPTRRRPTQMFFDTPRNVFKSFTTNQHWTSSHSSPLTYSFIVIFLTCRHFEPTINTAFIVKSAPDFSRRRHLAP